jgi:hypothetical protein
VFVLITVLDGCEVLPGSKYKTTCQNQTAEQQQRQTGERCHVTAAANFRIKLVLGESFHDGWFPVLFRETTFRALL